MRKSAHELSRQGRTLGGAVAYTRPVFECPACRHTTAPLDGELGLEGGENLSRGLVRKAAWSGARHSFAEAVADLKEMAGLELSAAEVARVAHAEGPRLDQAQRRAEQPFLEPVSPEQPAPEPLLAPGRLVIEGDATIVLTRPGEENKAVYCGAAFALEDRQQKDASARPFLAQRRHTASALSLEDFAQRLRALAYQMGLRQAREVAFLGDGAPALWTMAAQVLPEGTLLIQDFWHVCEHLADLAKELYGEAAAQGVLERWRQALRESRLEEILADLEKERKRRRGRSRRKLEQEIHYLEAGRERMDYARYEAAGWPIGSGAVEGECKHLVKERFCVTGAHWRRDQIGDVLALRLQIANGAWAEAWMNLN
jgi:hypothetical protein